MEKAEVHPDIDFYNMLIKKRSMRFDYVNAHVSGFSVRKLMLLKWVEKSFVFHKFHLLTVSLGIRLGSFSVFSNSYLNVALKVESGAKTYRLICI
jgi:hypothetical protein